MSDEDTESEHLDITKPAAGKEEWSDDYYEFVDTVDSKAICATMYWTGNDTATAIAEEDEWAIVEGDAEAGLLRGFSFNETTNTLDYEGDEEVVRKAVCTMSVTGTQNNTEYEVALFDDGEIARTRFPFTIDDSDDLIPVTVNHLVTVSPEDYYTVQVRCVNGDDDIVVDSLSLTIY